MDGAGLVEDTGDILEGPVTVSQLTIQQNRDPLVYHISVRVSEQNNEILVERTVRSFG